MISITIVSKVILPKSNKVVGFNRKIKIFKSMDEAKKEIIPIIKEMRDAKKEKREPLQRIDGVSYDTNSEKALLKELDALELVKG